jgi:hypothetical protein
LPVGTGARRWADVDWRYAGRDDKDMGESRIGRTVATAGALGLGSAAVAVWLVRHYGWEAASAIVAVATLPTVVVGIYLTLEARFRSARGSPAREPADLAGVADLLAVAIQRQWEAEAGLRRLNDPYPLPVRWEPADPGLVEDWPSLVRLATTGVGWPAPPATAPWAAGPGGLAGGGGELADVLGRVPTGRLVVLGVPGSGKTVLLVRLVLDLCARRNPGGPVPVLFPMASWDPTLQDLYGWLEDRLVLDHPALRDPAPGRAGVSRARALLDEKLVLPVLDGLDEIGDAARGSAVARVNQVLRPGQRLVLAARSQLYRAAVSPPGKIEVRLAGAAGIELRPLDPADVADYLRSSAGGPANAARWDPVLASLTAGVAPPVAQALATPLMATLARTVYNPVPGESAGGLPNPAELLDPARFPTRDRLAEHLFDGFITAAYRPHPEPAGRCRWATADCERWLVFLARHLDRTGTPDLAWWELRHAAPRRSSGFTTGIAAALGTGLIYGLAGFGLGAGVGLLAGLGVALTVRGRTPHLASGLLGGLVGGGIGAVTAWFAARGGIGPLGEVGGGVGAYLANPGPLGAGLGVGAVGGLRGGLAGGLVAGFTIGIIGDPLGWLANGAVVGVIVGISYGLACGTGVELAGRRTPARKLRWSPVGLPVGLVGGLGVGLGGLLYGGLVPGLVFGAASGCAGVLVGGLVGTPADLAEAAGPRAVLARDRVTFWVAGLSAGLCFWLGSAAGNEPGGGAKSWLAGVLWFAFFQAAWGSFAIARGWLALRRRLPWRLMSFLADAHQRGVLRQAGAVYEFRHIELQRRLANR